MVLKATYKLSDVKIDTPVNISNFMLEPVPERPNDTYLRFKFTHHPKADPYEESEKEIQFFLLFFRCFMELDTLSLKILSIGQGER